MSMSSTNYEMKQKLTDYMNTVFADAPNTPENRDLKEELTRNLLDRYDDLIAAGRTPSAAYSTAISGVGDIGELIGTAPASSAHETRSAGTVDRRSGTERKPRSRAMRDMTNEEREAVRRYRTRSTVMTTVAIALFILCCVPCIFLDETNVPEAVGVGLMFAMIAAGVVLLIINSMTKPDVLISSSDAEDKDDDDDALDADKFDGERRHPRTTSGKVYRALSAALWSITVVAYLIVNMVTGMWGISWMLFIIAAAVDNIMKAIFELVQNREE